MSRLKWYKESGQEYYVFGMPMDAGCILGLQFQSAEEIENHREFYPARIFARWYGNLEEVADPSHLTRRLEKVIRKLAPDFIKFSKDGIVIDTPIGRRYVGWAELIDVSWRFYSMSGLVRYFWYRANPNPHIHRETGHDYFTLLNSGQSIKRIGEELRIKIPISECYHTGLMIRFLVHRMLSSSEEQRIMGKKFADVLEFRKNMWRHTNPHVI